MKNTNIDSQSESTPLKHLKQVFDITSTQSINKRILCVGVDINIIIIIIIFVAIILGYIW